MSERSPLTLGAYALAALLALFELAVLWQALHPDVPDNYRAYYIDQSTTCLTQPSTGDYVLGTEIDFTENGPNTEQLRPCGWDGPSGQGVHSIGTSSRLKFAVGEKRDLTLMLELAATTLPGPAEQPVRIAANGETLTVLALRPNQTERFTLAIPAAAISDDGSLELEFTYPDAINPNGRTASTHWRAIKLVAASLTPQT